MSQKTISSSIKTHSMPSINKKVWFITGLILLVFLSIGSFLIFNRQVNDNELKARQEIIEKTNPGFVKSKTEALKNEVASAEGNTFSTDAKLANLSMVAYDYQSVGDYVNAIKIYEKMADYNDKTTNRSVYTSIGDAYKALGDDTKAIENYKKSKEQVIKLVSGDEQKFLLENLDNKIKELTR